MGEWQLFAFLHGDGSVTARRKRAPEQASAASVHIPPVALPVLEVPVEGVNVVVIGWEILAFDNSETAVGFSWVR